MYKSGLVSVTFRKLSCSSIIELVKDAKLQGIEWGSDIHVPCSVLNNAERVREDMEAAKLETFSYGSYYKVSPDSDPKIDFLPFLECAKILNTKNIRIWAGTVASFNADNLYYQKTALAVAEICKMAAQFQINISFEYHKNTLTDNKDSALRLLEAVNQKNIFTYWQPNPDLSFEENCKELSSILPFISNVHVFNLAVGNIRLPLKEGKRNWDEYIKIINTSGKSANFMLEFVKDDSKEAFFDDAYALNSLLT